MNKKIWIGLGVVALVIFWGVGARNGMAKGDQEVKASWANVQSAYQRRADLIPNLVNTVNGSAKNEKDILLQVTQARSEIVNAKTPEAPTVI